MYIQEHYTLAHSLHYLLLSHALTIIIMCILICYPSQLPTDGSPLNLNWIQSRLEQVSNERSKISTDKKMANTKLAKNKVCSTTIKMCMAH